MISIYHQGPEPQVAWTKHGERFQLGLDFKVTIIWSCHHLPATKMKGGLPRGVRGKESACQAGDTGSIPGLGRSPGEGNGNPFQYSFWENPMDRRAWQIIVYAVAKNWT